MSLVMEALRKLDRDRSAPEPGVIVVAARAWPVARRVRGTVLVALSAFGLVAFGFWLGTSPRPQGVSTSASPPPSPASAAVLVRPTQEAATPLLASPKARPGPAAEAERSQLNRALAFDASASGERADIPPPREAREQMASEEADGAPSALAPAPRGANERLPRLSAIGSRDQRPIAILDDRVMSEGDSFLGVTVVQIGETSVEIELAGRRHTLSF